MSKETEQLLSLTTVPSIQTPQVKVSVVTFSYTWSLHATFEAISHKIPAAKEKLKLRHILSSNFITVPGGKKSVD